MDNPFNLQVGDMVVIISDYLNNFGHIDKIYKIEDTTVVYLLRAKTTIHISHLEPLVRAKLPEKPVPPPFVPKFKKGDTIVSNALCKYNYGKYTCSSDSHITSDSKEFVSVIDIHPILNTEWFTKVPADFEFKVGDIVCILAGHNYEIMDIITGDDGLGYLKIKSLIHGPQEGFYNPKIYSFEKVVENPFVPTIKKGEPFVIDNLVHYASIDSYIRDNYGIEYVTYGCGIYRVSEVKRLAWIN